MKAITIIKIITPVFILFLNSCNKSSDYQGGRFIKGEKAKIQINWVGQWAGEGDKEKFLFELANEYEFLNQDVKVNIVNRDSIYNTSGEGEGDFILEQIKKPVADWDIVVRVHTAYSSIAVKLNDQNWGEKYLVDFSKIPGFMESHYSFINSKSYRHQYGNMIFGPYNEGQLACLYVNTEVAKKMGITVKQYDMTFEDLAEYLKAAYEYNKTHDYIAPIYDDGGWIHCAIIFRQLFLSLMDSYEQVLDPNLTQERIVALEKCYQAFEELSKYKPVIKNRNQMNWSRDNDFPLKDKCLFFPNYTFMYTIWKLKGKDQMYKIMPCELPVFKRSSTYVAGYVANWAVLKNAPHREEAIKLMMYWCKPSVAEKWVRYTKSPSGVKGNLTSTAFGIDPFESYMFTMDKKYGMNMVTDMDGRFLFGEKNCNVRLSIVNVLEGTMTAKQAMADFRRQIR